jgi:N6-L-threonylcarbamoyladenine synthase
MKVLAIESTCDETAAAVVESFGSGVRVLKNIVASSVEMHEKYGGIVPEVAAREQVKSIIPVITEAMIGEEIDAVAVSYGPGLIGSLLIGVETAKVLAWAWRKPLWRVNHMAAHVLANWIVGERTQELKNSRTQDIENFYDIPHLPAVGLVVSGGHTDLILLESLTNWTWIGGTRDDAAGEAFDKAARLLGLPYPGGPEMDKAASQVTDEAWKANKNLFKLPRPLIHDPGLDLSFSGIKAAVARMVESKEFREWIPDQVGDDTNVDELRKNILAREFSEAVTEVLVKKTLMAVEKFKPKSVILAGGVAANKGLRETLRGEVEKTGVGFFVPELKYCGDNAVMVGAAAILRPEIAGADLKSEPSLAVV